MPNGKSAGRYYSARWAPALRITAGSTPSASAGPRVYVKEGVRVRAVQESPEAVLGQLGPSAERDAYLRRPQGARVTRAVRLLADSHVQPSCIAICAAREEFAALRGVLDLEVPCVRCDDVAGIRALLTAGTCNAVVVTSQAAETAGVASLARLVHTFPDRAILGVVTNTDSDARALRAAHLWGRAGVTRVVDLRGPGARRDAQRLLRTGQCAWEVPVRHILDQVHSAIGWSSLAVTAEVGTGVAPVGGVEFFRLVFDTCTANTAAIASGLAVRASTLATRFARAGLPAPKRYHATARLVHAAYLGERAGVSIAAIAAALHASSPQSYARAVRAATGLSATEFRRTFSGDAMLGVFIGDLVRPYRSTLRRFDPRLGVVCGSTLGGEPPQPEPAQ